MGLSPSTPPTDTKFLRARQIGKWGVWRNITPLSPQLVIHFRNAKALQQKLLKFRFDTVWPSVYAPTLAGEQERLPFPPSSDKEVRGAVGSIFDLPLQVGNLSYGVR
jgi:hypothetical protein